MKTFHPSINVLDDGSETVDVWASDEYGQELIAEPTSRKTAECLADALNIVLVKFMTMPSDSDLYRLMVTLDKWRDQS